jgi:uncharacterized membrane-anchored protein
MRLLAAVGLLLFSVGATGALAQADDKQEAYKREVQAAWQAADAVAVRGPRQVALRDQAHITLPADVAFIPAAQADRIMTALGNSTSPGRLGLVVSTDPKSPWIIDIEWTEEGYVRDGDAKDWQPDAMLESMKEGTEEQNKARVERGIPAMEIVGWIEKPTYDSAANRLVWSMASKNRGEPDGQLQTVNYNTYALGRSGFVSMDLITGSDTVERDKAVVRGLLGTLQYEPGKRYVDFNESTDKVAAYGLAALVGAVAVKKMGLLAVIGVFLLKIWKLAMVAALGGFAAVKRYFGRLFGRNAASAEEAYGSEAAAASDDAEATARNGGGDASRD